MSLLGDHIQLIEWRRIAISEPRQETLFDHSVLMRGSIQTLGKALEVLSSLKVLVDDFVELPERKRVRVLDM